MYAETVVIYADLLFVINFSIDFLCLFLTSRILNQRSTAIRSVAAAAFGGLYSFIPYLAELHSALLFILHLLALAIICLIAFGFPSKKRFFVLTLTYLASSALFGGLVSAIYGLSSQYSDGVYFDTDALSFALICLASAIIALSYGLICRSKINVRSAEIETTICGTKVRARLLADSGNLVTEPFSALPVIILSSTALPAPFNNPEAESFPLSVRAIPFSTSAGKGCFLGFRPEKIEIVRLGAKRKAVNAYIAVDTLKSSYSGYDGIIPTSII